MPDYQNQIVLEQRSKNCPLDIANEIAAQLHLIAEQVFLHKEEKDFSLLGGKAGITLLFAYLLKAFPDETNNEQVSQLLDELSDDLAQEELSHSMSGGFAGIAFIFQHLRNLGIISKEDDVNLAEFDEFISKGAAIDYNFGNWDPLHGLIGLGIYFLERNKETGDKHYLEKIIDQLSKLKKPFESNKVWVTQGVAPYSADNYNFGMAHGMPGVLSFLARVYGRGIKQNEIKEMMESCIPFILNHECNDESVSRFPSSIDVVKKEKKEDERLYSRLAWCYGDLCVANALIHSGKALQNDMWLKKGIEVALCTTHRTFEESGCVDPGFCHGAVGIVHQYNRLYQITGNELFKNACFTWLAIMQQHYYKKGEGAAGYLFKKYKEESDKDNFEPDYGLLSGLTGIGLVYLSLLSDLKPDWDIVFLTNI
ncbi:MAG: lanthionine synthetase C family protein [Chitinophagales bacterium]